MQAMAVGIALLVLSAAPGAQEVIANAGIGVPTLSRAEVRKLFTMRLAQLPDKTPVQVFVLPDAHPTHAHFTKVVLGLFPYQLRSVWDRQTYSGTGQSPVQVNSEQEMLARIAVTPGAVGYVEHLTDHPGVRRLAVR